ncbi:hypothetical protein TELCIR_15935, partial [Teladorsagia circumcincta]
MNNLPFSSANAEGKELTLDDYDRVRTPHKSLADNTELRLRAGTLSTELSCPICLDLLTQTMTTKIWPDRKTYEDLQSVASEKFAAQTNMDALRSSIEEGIKAQEVNRRKRVQGSYECEKFLDYVERVVVMNVCIERKKKREEDGNANGTEDCAPVDNESTSPTEEDGDAAVPMSWSSTATTAPAAGFCNDFVEEEEVIDELDHLTEEELQAELDELEEVEIEENEDIEQESKSDGGDDMEHLAEFIHLRVMEEVQSNQCDFDADPVPTIPRPQHFYVFSRNDGHHIRKIFLHETMLTAQSAMTRDDHLIIFFDTEPPQLREEKSSVLEDVVHAHFLSLPH